MNYELRPEISYSDDENRLGECDWCHDDRGMCDRFIELDRFIEMCHEWGKQMRELNIGEHTLGPGGYRVAEPIWDKEEADRAEQGLPPLFDKYGDKQTRNFVRARYKKDPKTKELTTDPKTRRLELVLVRNTPPRN